VVLVIDRSIDAVRPYNARHHHIMVHTREHKLNKPERTFRLCAYHHFPNNLTRSLCFVFSKKPPYVRETTVIIGMYRLLSLFFDQATMHANAELRTHRDRSIEQTNNNGAVHALFQV